MLSPANRFACRIIRINQRRNLGGYDRFNQLVTTMKEARRFMVDCLLAVGAPQKHADIVAENLLEADCRGYFTHGMHRLLMYIKDIQDGATDPKAICCIEKETTGTALVNGNNGLGAVVGKYSMGLAIEIAKCSGIGFVAVHGSNHYGIAGIYVLQAINNGFLGMTFSNTSPLVVPTRAKTAVFGTNPLAMGAPCICKDNFVLDISTSAVSFGKIQEARKKRMAIPEGWLASPDKGDHKSDDAFREDAKLLPLGGTEKTSGYKGYGIGMMVEIFAGVLSGANYGPYVRKWGINKQMANLGHVFIAIDPKCFCDSFRERMSDFVDHIRHLEPSDPNHPVLVHGDPERIHMQQVKADGGLIYPKDQHEINKSLAKELDIKPMMSKRKKI